MAKSNVKPVCYERNLDIIAKLEFSCQYDIERSVKDNADINLECLKYLYAAQVFRFFA